jgi:predicted MFS family arabinose efflux permease
MHQSNSCKKSFLLSHMLQEPFVALYSMMAILLTKEVGASAFQIAILSMLKPTVAVLSFYWGSLFLKRRSVLKTNLLIATCFSVFPFLFSPLVNHAWYFVLAGALYTLFSKAAVPARMELLKINSSDHERERLFAKFLRWAYGIGVVSSLCFGPLLDLRPESWKLLLCVTALISLFSVLVLSSIPDQDEGKDSQDSSLLGVKEHLLHPWRETIALLKSRPDFLQFQIGFFLAGFGLMLVMPAIPKFLSELEISYTELFLSIGVLKGLGFVLSSEIWADKLKTLPIKTITSLVFAGFCLFILMLLLAHFDARCVLAAYAIYGVAQAGSQLLWHLSGPIFAGKQASYQYSSVNVLAIGLRGIIAPPLGGLITELVNPTATVGAGLLVGFCAIWYMLRSKTAEPCQPTLIKA